MAAAACNYVDCFSRVRQDYATLSALKLHVVGIIPPITIKVDPVGGDRRVFRNCVCYNLIGLEAFRVSKLRPCKLVSKIKFRCIYLAKVDALRVFWVAYRLVDVSFDRLLRFALLRKGLRTFFVLGLTRFAI